MRFHINKKLWFAAVFVIALIALPITITALQEQLNTRTRAEKTVILSYTPTFSQANPMQIPAGTTFSLDVYVDPGQSSVSYVKTEMLYDSTKFEHVGGFIPNQEVFSQIVESPLNTPGKIVTTLSIGTDLTKALRAKTKVGTLTLKALATVPTKTLSDITFGGGSQVLSVNSNDSFNENVIARTIPVTIEVSQPMAGQTCGYAASDALLVIDKSGSMNDRNGTTGTKISNAKTAASNFIDILAKDTRNYVGLSTFASTGTLNSQLSNNYPAIKNQINGIIANGHTCVECGILKANQEIYARKRPNVKNAVILLTDGIANFVEGNNREVSKELAESRAIAAAKSGHSASGTIYFTIGLGKDVNSAFLTRIADDTGGQYFYSPTTDQLNSIYTQISQILAKGSISGYIFDDADANGVYEGEEEKLPGWTVELYKNNSQTPQFITSDSTGTYSIVNLCDGTYTIKQIMQSGWKQTAPANPKEHTFTLTNGSAVTDKNFGNIRSSRCADLIDNDGNGYVDARDATCHSDGNPNNTESYEPDKDGERSNNTCSDSKDNNENGKIDGADPVCHTDGDPSKPWDPSLPETDPTPTPTSSPTPVYPTNSPTPLPTYEPTAVPTVYPSYEPTAAPTLVPTAIPYPTEPLGKVRFDLNVILHGRGIGGDNANPSGNAFSNKNPVNPTQKASLAIFDTTNQLVATATGQVTYNSSSGTYVGTVSTNTDVPAGYYNMKVTVDRHLTRLVPGIQSIQENTTTTVKSVDLITGDTNRDNKLDIRDYNNLLDCYSDIGPAISCDDLAKQKDSDINDDSKVNQFDYNLFLRELSTQPGE